MNLKYTKLIFHALLIIQFWTGSRTGSTLRTGSRTGSWIELVEPELNRNKINLPEPEP